MDVPINLPPIVISYSDGECEFEFPDTTINVPDDWTPDKVDKCVERNRTGIQIKTLEGALATPDLDDCVRMAIQDAIAQLKAGEPWGMESEPTGTWGMGKSKPTASALELYTHQVKEAMKRISAQRLHGRTVDVDMDDFLDKLLPYFKTAVFIGFSNDVPPAETAALIVDSVPR
jgi:hypothetical protein